MAAAFPGSQFEGLDVSRHAIDRARGKAAENGLENAVFRTAGAEDLPDDYRYDLVLTLDCLHDMPRPAEAVAAIRRAIRPDGTLLIRRVCPSLAEQGSAPSAFIRNWPSASAGTPASRVSPGMTPTTR